MSLIAALIFAFVVTLLPLLVRRARAPGPGTAPEDGDGLEQPVTAPVQRESFLDRWEKRARQAGLPWQRSSYVAMAATGLAFALLFSFVGLPYAGVVVALVGLIGPNWYVSYVQGVRSAMLARQLPQMLFLSASVLRAGGTFMQAVDVVAAEMPNPMGEEFKYIQQQLRLGTPVQQAMAEAQGRVAIREFAAVVVATRITQEVGGNLAHIFDEIGRSLIEAEGARRTVRAFTTEGRMSANLIAGLPFVVMGLLQLLSPGYFQPLFASWGGRIIVFLSLGTIFVGWRVIRNMINIRIF